MRLRIFDLATPWFWLLVTWQRAYSEPWLQITLYPPPKWCRGWFDFWRWEHFQKPNRVYAAKETPS